MVHRVLACLDTLVDLILKPGWNGDYEDFDRRQAEVEQLVDLIESDRLLLYVPPILASTIHMTVKLHFGVNHACQVVHQVLRIANSNLRLDYERALEQANALLIGQERLDLYEAILLTFANALRADAIVARRPHSLRQLVTANNQELPEFNIPILTIGELVNSVTDQQFSDDLNNEGILVFTPEYRIIKLPQGATPIDFAYEIHTKVGDQCIAAKINGFEVPLNTPLENGNVVEIIRGSRAEPNPEWLTFVATRTAKRGIRRGLRRLWAERGWETVKQTLGKNVRAYRQKLESVAELHNYSTNDLIIKVGSGRISAQHLQQLVQDCTFQQVGEQALSAAPPEQISSDIGHKNWRLASCCNPLPGDSIVGIIGTGGRTIRVHHSDCSNLESLTPNQLHNLTWNCNLCSIQLLIVMTDDTDILRPLLNRLVEISLTPNVRNLYIAPDGTARASIAISVASRQQLDQILQQIEEMPSVINVQVTKLMPVWDAEQ